MCWWGEEALKRDFLKANGVWWEGRSSQLEQVQETSSDNNSVTCCMDAQTPVLWYNEYGRKSCTTDPHTWVYRRALAKHWPREITHTHTHTYTHTQTGCPRVTKLPRTGWPGQNTGKWTVIVETYQPSRENDVRSRIPGARGDFMLAETCVRCPRLKQEDSQLDPRHVLRG